MARKICAIRKTKDHPKVYLVKDLRRKAIKEGHEASMVNKLTKSNLCALLNIEWVGKQSQKTRSSDSSFIEIEEWGTRECNVRPSKTHPKAFGKEELVNLAVKHLKLKNANTYSKKQLCALLKAQKVKVPSPKKASSKKKPKVDKPSEKTKKDKKAELEEKKPKKVKPIKKPKADKEPKKEKTPKKPKEKKIKTSAADCIQRSKLSLKPHQIALVEHLKTNRGIIAAFDVGAGKTLTAVAATQCYLDSNPNGKVIIVTPKSLQDNFKKELKAYGVKRPDNKYEFYTIRNFATQYKNGCPDNVFLVIDEAHNLRTTIKTGKPKSKAKARTEKESKESVANAITAVKCAKTADKVLLLTATPLYNKPHDLINLAAMVKGTDPLTKTEFERKTQKELCKYFKDTIMFFENPKTDDYPDKEEHTIRVIMTNDFYKEYRKVEERKSGLWSAKNPWTFLTVVRQATNAVDPCLKCQWTVDKILEDKKTLVYSAFVTHGVKKLQGMLDELGIKYVEVTGSMSMEARKKAVSDYNSNKVKVMFITKAGGEGLDLKGTRYVILLEKSWNRPNEEQIIGRAVRFRSHTHLPKDEQKVDVYHLIITKPAPSMRDKNDSKESADDMLEKITIEKEEKNRMFLKLLKSASIDAPKGTKCPPQDYIEITYGPEKEKRKPYKVVVTENKYPSWDMVYNFGQQNVNRIAGILKIPVNEVVYVDNAKTTEVHFEVKLKKDVAKTAKTIAAAIAQGSGRRIFGSGIWVSDKKEKSGDVYDFTFKRK